MKIVRFDPQADHQSFLQMRKGTIGGSNAKENLPLTRGKDKRPAGFWKRIAEKLFIEPDGEKPIDRGHRVEANGCLYVTTKFNLTPAEQPGMWVSDEDKDLHVTPDCAEDGDNPTWAIENKALNSENHVQAIAKDLEAKELDGYNPFDSLYISTKNDFRHQVKTYFSVNKDLQTLYFNLHDDRATREVLMNYTIIVKREDIGEEAIEEHKTFLLNSIMESRHTIKFILSKLENM